MWERGCFPATILEQLRRPCRSRHPYAVPRTSLQCVCTRRRNCIAQLSPSREYALRTVDFPARNSATIELTHTAAVPDEGSPSQTRPQRTQSEQMSSGFLCSSAHILPSNCRLVGKMPSHQQERLDHNIRWSPRCALQDCRRKGR
jgi:hypothetical protein